MKGILFDLDGTLLDIDIEEFLSRYFSALGEAVSEMLDGSGDHARAMQGIYEATSAMMQPHPRRTNRDEFNRAYLEYTGIDIAAHAAVFERFYDAVFPGLRGQIAAHAGAREALAQARACGMRVAVATNPIFPLRAIEHRLGWAGIEPAEVDFITSYENMFATKPHPDYFRHVCTALELSPTECLMVGDYRMLDLPAADVGMRTFYVGPDPDAPADYRGSLGDLVELLRRSCSDGQIA